MLTKGESRRTPTRTTVLALLLSRSAPSAHPPPAELPDTGKRQSRSASNKSTLFEGSGWGVNTSAAHPDSRRQFLHHQAGPRDYDQDSRPHSFSPTLWIPPAKSSPLQDGGLVAAPEWPHDPRSLTQRLTCIPGCPQQSKCRRRTSKRPPRTHTWSRTPGHPPTLDSPRR
jgi:hypothetical protein